MNWNSNLSKNSHRLKPKDLLKKTHVNHFIRSIEKVPNHPLQLHKNIQILLLSQQEFPISSFWLVFLHLKMSVNIYVSSEQSGISRVPRRAFGHAIYSVRYRNLRNKLHNTKFYYPPIKIKIKTHSIHEIVFYSILKT